MVTQATSEHAGKTCPYCQQPVKPGDEIVLCGSCGIPHHKVCWDENGGCTTYGCDSQPETNESKPSGLEFDEAGDALSLIDLRPMDFGDILDGTIRVYRERPWLFVVILAIWIAVPIYISQVAQRPWMELNWEALRAYSQGASSEAQAIYQSREFYATNIALLVSSLLQFFLLPLAIGGTVHAVSETIIGHAVDLKRSMRVVKTRILRIVLAYLLYGLILLLLFLPFLVFMVVLIYASPRTAFTVLAPLSLTFPIFLFLMIYFYVKCLFIPHSVILEDIGPLSALKRSFSLTRGHWWRTMGTVFLIGIIVSVIGYLLGLAVKLVEFGFIEWLHANKSVTIAITAGLSAFLTLLIAPITWIATTLMYYDLRIRKEGFDLLLLAGSVIGDNDSE